MAKEGEPKSTFCAFSLCTPTESVYFFSRCAQLPRRPCQYSGTNMPT